MRVQRTKFSRCTAWIVLPSGNCVYEIDQLGLFNLLPSFLHTYTFLLWDIFLDFISSVIYLKLVALLYTFLTRFSLFCTLDKNVGHPCSNMQSSHLNLETADLVYIFFLTLPNSNSSFRYRSFVGCKISSSDRRSIILKI